MAEQREKDVNYYIFILELIFDYYYSRGGSKRHSYFNAISEDGPENYLYPKLYGFPHLTGFASSRTKRGYVCPSVIIETEK